MPLQVTHSTQGMETLRHFLIDVCGVTADWKMQDVLEEEIKVINDMVRPDEHVICALSGGVDSTVAATLVHKAIGDRLHCVFVDNGLLRSYSLFVWRIFYFFCFLVSLILLSSKCRFFPL